MIAKNDYPKKRHRIHVFLLGLFVVIWLLPLVYVGLNSSGICLFGNHINNIYRVSCLFTRRTPVWHNYYIELQTQGNQEWIGLPLTEFSKMKPFGHTTRLHRMLSEARWDKNGNKIRAQLASFVKQRYEEKHPDSPPVVVYRLIRVAYKSGSDETAKPKGHWTVPPLNTIPPSRRVVEDTHKFETQSSS